MSQRNFETDFEKLKKALSEAVERGNSWGENGTIAIGNKFFILDRIQNGPQALNNLSKIYYDAASEAAFRAKKANPLVRLFWQARANHCSKKAATLSDWFFEEVGLEGMSVQDLELRTAILWRIGRRKESFRCREEAVKLHDEAVTRFWQTA